MTAKQPKQPNQPGGSKPPPKLASIAEGSRRSGDSGSDEPSPGSSAPLSQPAAAAPVPPQALTAPPVAGGRSTPRGSGKSPAQEAYEAASARVEHVQRKYDAARDAVAGAVHVHGRHTPPHWRARSALHAAEAARLEAMGSRYDAAAALSDGWFDWMHVVEQAHASGSEDERVSTINNRIEHTHVDLRVAQVRC